MSLPPPDYSAPLAIRRPSLPVNAHASSSRSSSRTRSRPRPSRTNSARLEDFVHWVPAPPPDETAKLPSSITINYPPEDLIVLLSPPRVDPLGEEDWSHEAGMGGRDASLTSTVTIISPKRRLVEGLRITVVGRQRLSTSQSGSSDFEESEIFRRELEHEGSEENGGDVLLDKGVNIFKYSIRFPASAALSDRCKNGKIEYVATTTLLGTGSAFKKDIKEKKVVWVVSNPSSEDRPLQFQQHEEGISPILGPFALEIVSTEFLVGAPLSVTLTLAVPPSTLTIFAFLVSIQQTTYISRNGKVFEVKGPKQPVLKVGASDGWSVAGFAARQRKKGKLVFDGTSSEGRDADGGWVLKEMGRLPDDNDIRPTTLPGTKTDLRFTSELSVDIVLSETSAGDQSLKLLTILKQDVFLTSCICVLERISLPSYSPDHPEEEQPMERPICRCVEKWETLRQSELAAITNGEADERGENGWVVDGGGDRDEKSERPGRWDGVGQGRSRRKIGETFRTR